MKPLHALIASLFIPCALFVSAAQQSPGANPTIRSTSALVVLDVVVTDHGHPVQGLPRDGFHIVEDGRAQTLQVFEEHKASQAQAPQAPPALPASTYSNFPERPVSSATNVLLLDAMNTPLQDQMYVRKEMIEYLKQIPPHSYTAIFALGSRLRLVQGFTAQAGSLIAALQGSKQNPAASSLLPDPGDSSASDITNSAAEVGASSGAMDVLRQFQADTAVFQTDLRVRNTLDAMNRLADYLSPIPGRKNLIWLSGSFPLSLDPDVTLPNSFSVQRQYSTEIKETSDRLTAARVAVYPVDVRGLLSSPSLSAANRNPGYAGVTGPSTSIAGPSGNSGIGGRGAGGRRTGRQPGTSVSNPNSYAADDAKFMKQTTAEHATMQQIAEETGGVPFYDSNAIKDAVAQAIENGANYYTLAYVPEDKKFDGSFRRIKVELANGNYQIAYRHGYYADSREKAASASPLTPSAGEIQRGAPPSSQILFKVRVLAEGDPALAGLQPQPGPAGFLAAKLKGKTKRYWIDFAADAHQVEFQSGADGLRHGSLEFMALAYDQDGTLLNVITRAFTLNLQPAQYAQIMQTGMPVHEELDLPAGGVYLRVAVHDLSTGHIGTTEVPIKVTVP